MRIQSIKGTGVVYVDNKPLLDMFLQRPLGLFALLDEESFFPKGSDTSLVNKLQSNLKKFKYFEPPRSQNAIDFGINHYAGTVTYIAFGFLEKNRDSLSEVVKSLMVASSNSLMHTIFLDERPPENPAMQWQTIADNTKTSTLLKGLHPGDADRRNAPVLSENARSLVEMHDYIFLFCSHL